MIKCRIGGTLIILCLIISSCSPCKRLSRLSSKHPQCFKALNEVRKDSGSVPIADRDSFTRASDSAIGTIVDTFAKYIEIISDCNSTREQKDSAITRVKKQATRAKETTRGIIDKAPCLSDTATFNDPGGATLKLWQEGKEIKYSLTYPHIEYKASEPGLPWWAWLCAGFVLATVLYVVRGSKG